MRKEYDFSRMKEIRNPYAGRKKAVGINLSAAVIDYFKKLTAETGIPYQKLIFPVLTSILHLTVGIAVRQSFVEQGRGTAYTPVSSLPLSNRAR